MRVMFGILDRYICKEILSSWLAVLFVLLLVVMSAEVARLLSWVVEGRITVSVLLPLLFNNFIKNAVLLMPLSLMLAVLLAFGRFYKDSEMAAIMSAGVGPMSWYRPVLWVVLPATVALLIMMLFVVPQMHAKKQAVMQQSENTRDLASLMAGRFNPAHSGDAVFFIESQVTEKGKVDGVFLKHSDDGIDSVDTASWASNQKDEYGDTYLVMHQGQQYMGKAGNNDYRIIEYGEYGIRLPNTQSAPVSPTIKSTPSSQLWQSSDVRYQAELHWRITVPIAMLIICLIAVPLSHTQPRSGRYAKLAMALLLYLLYSNLLGMSKTWIANETIPLWLASWWVHAAAVVLLLGLLKHYGYLARGATQ